MDAAKVPFGWPVPSPPVPNNGTKGRTLGLPATIDGVMLSNGCAECLVGAHPSFVQCLDLHQTVADFQTCVVYQLSVSQLRM